MHTCTNCGKTFAQEFGFCPYCGAKLRDTSADPASMPDTSGTCGRNVTWKFEDGTLTIGGTGKTDDFRYDSLKKAVLTPWAELREAVKVIKIQSGITGIGDRAFSGCSGLTRVGIPDTLTDVGYNAFYGCRLLADVYCSGTEEQWEKLRLRMYAGNERLTQAKLHCEASLPVESAEPAEKPEGSGTCGENLTWKFAEGILTVSGTGAMDDMGFVDGVDIAPWAELQKDIRAIVVGSGVTSIGINAFNFCENLTEAAIADSVERIGAGAFTKCPALTRVEIPAGVTTIEEGTFEGCKALAVIDIPDSVTGIEEWAFEDCGALKDIRYSGSEEQWNAINIAGGNEALTRADIRFNTL